MWTVEYLKAAVDDLKKLDRSQNIEIINKINQVASNPLPKNEGGYGNPLGSRSGADLTGYCKIKLLKLGIRVVYRLEKSEETMKIVVISARAADEVYSLAVKRIQK
jgi:mRNA interferase RelE/StbE